MREHCGVAGVYDFEQKRDVVPICTRITLEQQNRGQLGAGEACMSRITGRIELMKGHGLVKEVLTLAAMRDRFMEGPAAIGHTRYATDRDHDWRRLHPYFYDRDESPVPLAHCFNGTAHASRALMQWLINTGNAPQIESDTEIIGRTLIAGLKEYTQQDMKRVLGGLGGLDGAYNVVALIGNDISAVRDRRGFRPMVVGVDGPIAAVASEDRALLQALPHAKVWPVKPGHAVHFRADKGEIEEEKIWDPIPHRCFFEWVYFLNYGSTFDGISAEEFRIECGRILGEMDAGWPEGIVVGVPESARLFAQGYARTRGLQTKGAIKRNKQSALNEVRSFMLPEEMREQAAEEKYNVYEEEVRGKVVYLMDDSIVRGTTMRVLARELKAKGAKEVHLRLASPPILSPCFYGIDFPTVRELLVRKYYKSPLREGEVVPDDVLAALAKDLGVDSIKFLPVSGIARAMGIDPSELILDMNGKTPGTVCVSCIRGDYPDETGQRLALQQELAVLDPCNQ